MDGVGRAGPEDGDFSRPVSLMPPGRRTTGGYSETVRNWGDNTQREPEESAAQTLAAPRRNASNAGSFNQRMQTTLVAQPPSRAPSDRAVGASSRPPRPPPTRIGRPLPPATLSAAPSVRGRRAETGSTIQGRKTVRISVVPIGGGGAQANFLRSSAQGGVVPSFGHPGEQQIQSFAPIRLLDVENGTSILVTKQAFLDNHRFQPLDKEGAIVVTAKGTAPIAQQDSIFFKQRGQSLQDRIRSGDIRNFDINAERGILGGAWRGVLRRLMMWSLDDVNGLRMGRQLQLTIPFQTVYEAYIVSQIIESMDGKPDIRRSDVNYVLTIAFKNRNVSRFLVQNLGPRWDFLWHWYDQVTSNRLYDGFGQIPIIGITGFSATENFPATRDHVLASSFRVLFGEGRWITRVLTQNRQGLNTDNPDKNIAQNLAAESNGFELANRNQYGTYVGRIKTNSFRIDHRLPVDESIVRTFVSQPMPTLINNGAVHTLRQLAKHWHNMLFQSSGNFAHQRMEQLDPFETMRFHMPVVCVVLASLRGRNRWDSKVLGPFIRKCQELKSSFTTDGCQYLVREMQ